MLSGMKGNFVEKLQNFRQQPRDVECQADPYCPPDEPLPWVQPFLGRENTPHYVDCDADESKRKQQRNRNIQKMDRIPVAECPPANDEQNKSEDGEHEPAHAAGTDVE